MARFLKSYFFQDTPDNSRFQEGDEPTEQEFLNLFNSIAFIREQGDTAKLNEQGLAKCTEDVNAANRDSTEGPDQMTRFIKAHQLPNTIAGEGIGVTAALQATGRTGGQGKDFTIRNLHSFVGLAPIVITSATIIKTGNIQFTISIDQTSLNALESGKVKVSAADTTANYLFNKIVSLNPNIIITLQNPALNETVGINWVERVGTVQMFFGDVATIFAGSYNNTIGHIWRGWALCNGGTYNAVVTPDMRGFVPIGYNPDVTANPKYSTLGAHVDDTAVAGENAHTLVPAEIPKHAHMITDTVDGASQSNPGNHTHSYVNWPNQADIGEGGTTATDNSVATNQVTGSAGAHVHSGHTGNGASDPLGLGFLNDEAHENRQPFTALAFIMYVGF